MKLRPGYHRSSVLALLETNKQICKEATGIYYAQNRFVFYYSSQVLEFFDTLTRYSGHGCGHRAFDYMTDVTLWYPKNYRTQDASAAFDCALRELKKCSVLEKIEVILECYPPQYLGQGLAASRPGERKLKKFSHRGVAVTVRSIEVENFECDGASPHLAAIHFLSAKRAVEDFERSINTWP